MSTTTKIIILVICFLLLLLSAFFSSSEYVYSQVNKFKIKKDMALKKKKAKIVDKLAGNYSYTIAIILIGNNLVNILMTSLVTIVSLESEISDALTVIILTIIILIFGEIIPKAIGPRYSYRLSYLFAKPMLIFSYIFFPIVKAVTFVIEKISFIWKPTKNIEIDPTRELGLITDKLEEEGIIDENDAKLLHKAIEFSETTAYEIMVPRVDVYAIDINDYDDDVLKDNNIYRYSRVPVYDESKDDLIGILDTTALMKKVLMNEKIDIRKMLKDPYYIPKHKDISELLTEFKTEGEQLAVILDEFGGMMGIVSLEDVLEELVGDIFDETDEVRYDYVATPDGSYLIDGDMNIYDFFELIDYDDRDFDADYTTVGGFCNYMLEKFPEVGDEFDFAHVNIYITEISDKRVEQVKVVKNINEIDDGSDE